LGASRVRPMSVELAISTLFRLEKCCVCGTAFYMDETLYFNRKKDGQLFWCPNGHEQHYTETDTTRLAKANAELERLHSQLAIEKDQHRAAVADLNRLKERTKNGICPCCNRHFTNLERHIRSKHKSFVKLPDKAK
jgi:hypothetical protein